MIETSVMKELHDVTFDFTKILNDRSQGKEHHAEFRDLFPTFLGSYTRKF